MKLHFPLFISIALLLTSCRFLGGERIYGNGNVTSRTQAMDGITGVRVKGGLDVYVVQGPGSSVKLEGEQNLLEYIEIERNGNLVEVHTREGYNLKPSKDLKVYVTAPVLNEFYIDGSGDLRSQSPIRDNNSIRAEIRGSGDIYMDVNAPTVDASISGSGTINMKGSTKDFKSSIAGAGDIKCYDLMSETASVDIKGSGDAQVYASRELSADIKGAGDVHYKGNASIKQQSIHGAGSITKVQ